MREFKFRVYIPDRGKFSYFQLNEFDYPDRYLSQHLHPVQQFTGIEDRNGVEIYEGDILEVPWSFGGSLKGQVVFWKGAFYLSKGRELEYPELCPFDLYSFSDAPCRREFWHNGRVIGTITENPDLLK